jgi:hypothetical protein
VVLSNRFAAQPTFSAPNVSEAGECLMFQLTVTDSAGLFARDSCIVNVVWVNQAPAANAGADQNVDQGVSVALNGTGSTDPDGGILAYSWLQTGGTPVTLDNPNSAQPRFLANTGGAGSSLVFRLTVADPGGLSASDDCSIAVNGSTSAKISIADLSGQWLSLTRSVKRSVSTYKAKIRVMNLGGQSAPSSLLRVYQSSDMIWHNTDLLVGRANIASIPAGGYLDVAPRLSGTYNGSPVYLIIVLDAANAVSETDEANNKIVSSLVP